MFHTRYNVNNIFFYWLIAKKLKGNLALLHNSNLLLIQSISKEIQTSKRLVHLSVQTA